MSCFTTMNGNELRKLINIHHLCIFVCVYMYVYRCTDIKVKKYKYKKYFINIFYIYKYAKNIFNFKFVTKRKLQK